MKKPQIGWCIVTVLLALGNGAFLIAPDSQPDVRIMSLLGVLGSSVGLLTALTGNATFFPWEKP